MASQQKTFMEDLASSIFSPHAEGLSKGIENLVLGVLRFLFRFSYTLWRIFRHPKLFVLEAVLSDEPKPQFIPPYTFLTLCGFVFTIAISAFPYGIFVVFNDGIFAAEEIADGIQTRWQESLSTTTLILSAFPVLITVGAFAHIWSYLLWDGERRQQISRASAYAFGFACLFFFTLYIVLAGTFIPKHFGLSFELNPNVFLFLFFAQAIIVPGGALLYALLILIHSVRLIEDTKHPPRWIKLSLTPIYFVSVFILTSYTASIPGAYKEYRASLLPERKVGASIAYDPELKLDTNSGGAPEVNVNFGLVVQNYTGKRFVESISSVQASLSMDVSDWANDTPLGFMLASLTLSCSSSNGVYSIVVDPKGYAALDCIGTVLPDDRFERFLRLHIADVEAERHLRIDPSAPTLHRMKLKVGIRNATNPATSVVYRFK